jgi:sporulation protein YqfC
MDIVNKVRNYLLEEEFSVNVYKDKVHVINYSSIGIFNSKNVTINYDGGTLNISGDNLIVKRLLDEEVLILGKIRNVELK